MNTTKKKIAELLQNKTNSGETSVSVSELQAILDENDGDISNELRSRATTYIEQSRKIDKYGEDLLKELLEDIGRPISFNWFEDDAPSINADCFGDDIADAYVTKIWAENNLVKVNLHAYYIGEDVEDKVLKDVCVTPNYADLIDYILTA